ncbi:carboxylesterase 5A-like isoform X2 [Hypanus sabinus]|uniref:carboxylesterase 5A-like isoform X2 n=1 Tax=Hypanus sabinus TaxID=79690 RepID=UPI0028C417D0|nr:carboxylesterase 5A-like isoform X2 [Hypanus sabinus]
MEQCPHKILLTLTCAALWTISSAGVQRLTPTVLTEDGWLWGRQMEVEGSHRPVHGCLQRIRRTPVPFVVAASEDCLYLSVYTPASAAQHRSPVPVMVFIHGGAFILGKSSLFYGSALASVGNVVVVVVQYRISVAGFLSTGDEWARGNFGFLDQVAALQWVQRNIGQFGGDPRQVTLFGESVGSLSVSLHALSPLSANLFHKAILQSGSALMPGVLPPLPTQLVHEAAEIAGCNDTQSQVLLQCLRNKTEDEMFQITNRVNDLYQLIPIVVDGYFLPDDPQKMFQDGKFRKIPYLMGVTTEEAVKSLVHPEVIIKPDWEAGITRDEIREKITTYLHPLFGAENGEMIFDEYFKDVYSPDLLKERYLDLFGDVFITIPTLRAAQYYRDDGNPVFLYEFQHRASFYETRIPQFTRAAHGAELSFVFGGPFIRDFDELLGNTSEQERQLSKSVMLYWAEFARSGNPNLNNLPVWPMNSDHDEYMQLNLTLHVGCSLKTDKLQFWSNKPARKIAKILI